MAVPFKMGEKLPVLVVPDTEGYDPNSVVVQNVHGVSAGVELTANPLAVFVTAVELGISVISFSVVNTDGVPIAALLEVEVLPADVVATSAIALEVGTPVPA